MIKSFEEIINLVKSKSEKKICVTCAHDEDVLKSVIEAKKMGLAKSILVGKKEEMLKIFNELGEDASEFEIVDEADDKSAAKKAVEIVKSGRADVLMKGQIHTSEFTKAVLDKELGLRTGEILSHIIVAETESYEKLLAVSDGGINIAPDLMKKVSIVNNSVKVSKALNIEKPKVAVLAALELVNPNMPATMDAALLSKMAERGQIKDCIIDGPLAVDNAISALAAKHKGITSPVSGDPDVLIVPDIEAGNILIKSLVYLSNAKTAGIIMGATHPLVVTSRSDSYETKLNSIALALII